MAQVGLLLHGTLDATILEANHFDNNDSKVSTVNPCMPMTDSLAHVQATAYTSLVPYHVFNIPVCNNWSVAHTIIIGTDVVNKKNRSKTLFFITNLLFHSFTNNCNSYYITYWLLIHTCVCDVPLS